MGYRTETFIEFIDSDHPCAYWEHPRKSEHRDASKIKRLDMEPGYEGFRFYTVLITAVGYKGKVVKLRSQPINFSKTYWRR